VRNIAKKVVLVLYVFVASNSMANEPGEITERERLRNVVTELGYIQEYLVRSKSVQKINKRSRFNYGAARHRIEVLKYDIELHLNEVGNQPKYGLTPFENEGG
jgi:RAQPRD family integrative conjugative element protein